MWEVGCENVRNNVQQCRMGGRMDTGPDKEGVIATVQLYLHLIWVEWHVSRV